MTKTKKWSLAAGILLIGMIISFVVGFFPKSVDVHAEENYYSAELYTGDDGLLQEDGTHSTVRDIRDFANDVKQAGINRSFPELVQVVPRQYLETTEQNVAFAYNGKEYGFYLAKEGDYFDLLLIDFVYEFGDVETHPNHEYKIRIEPILQESFIRLNVAGELQWRKTGTGPKYYVANPRFLSVVQNENALNYGDAGYSKQTDDGVIISETRTNYSKISHKTEEDVLETCDEFLGDKILSTVTDSAVNFLDKYTGGLVGFFKDLLDLSDKLYEGGQETTINLNNEENILTQQTKSEQLKGPKDGYSRVAGFYPTDEIILAAADDASDEVNENSYAEFITQLSETNYRTRLNQYCEFDIYRRNGLYDSMEKVNNPNGEKFYSFSKERILFSEDQEKTLAFDTAQATYNLPHGTDIFTFSPTVSGTYTFTADDSSANLSLYYADDQEDAIFSGNNSNSAYLQGGTKYLLYAGMNQDESGRYIVQATVATWGSGTTKTNQPIPAGGQLYKLQASERDGYQISSTNKNVRFRLYDEDMGCLYESDVNHFTHYLVPGEQYYVRVYSTTASAQTTTLTFSSVESLEQGETYFIQENYPVMYRFTAPSTLTETTYYTILFEDSADDLNAEVYGNSNPVSYASTEDFYSINLSMQPGEDIYIQMESSSPFTVIINQTQNLFTWSVDGVDQESNTVLLQQGKKYQIGLKIDGVQVDNAIYSENGLLKGTTLDLTDYQYITDPKNNETYLRFSPIGSFSPKGDRFPMDLMVCVTHNFDFQFGTYNNNSNYGFTWKDLSSDSSESFNINYTVTAGGNSTEDQQVLQVRSASSQSVMSAVAESLAYSGYEDVTIVIDSVDLKIKDINGTFQYRATIYNTESDKFDEVLDIREQYQNFTCAALKVNPLFDGGNGTANDPFQIKYYRHFNNIRKITRYDSNAKGNYVYGCYALTANITLSSSFMPLDDGYAYFDGIIDGNGHSISGYTASGTNTYLGLIKNNYAHIFDLTLKDFNIDVNGDYHSGGYAGALCALNHGDIEDISVQNSTIIGLGYSTVGGIVGFHENGTIDNCSVSTSATITGTYVIGGIAGSTGDDIEDSTFSGQIRYTNRYNVTDNNGNQILPEAMIGGIVGCLDENSTVSGCKFYGTIVVNVNLWDDRTFQPRIGGIVGMLYSGQQTNNTSSGSINVDNLNPDVSWWEWFVTYHHNQRAYCGQIVGNPVVNPLS